MMFGVCFPFVLLGCSLVYGAGMGGEIDAAPCPSRQPEWVDGLRSIEGLGVVVDRDTFIDPLGRVYIAGFFAGIVDLDPTDGVAEFKAPNPEHHAFLTAVNPDGSYAWTFVQEAPESGTASVGISVDMGGNLVLATCLVLAPQLVAPRITWLTQDGVPFRIVEFASAEYVMSHLAVASNGGVYVSGMFVGTIDFNPGKEVDQHTSSGWDPFLTKLNTDGSHAWTRTFGGVGFDTTAGVATDPEGNVIITGTFRGTVDFDPGPGVDIHFQQGFIEDSFITKFLADGSYAWTRTYPLVWTEGKGKPAVDRQGNIFFTDAFIGTMDFDPDGPGGEHTANGESGDVIVVKLSPDGDYLWSFATSDGEGNEGGFSIANGENDHVFVGGQFRFTSDFDPGPGEAVLTSGRKSGFLLHLSPNGKFVSVARIGDDDGETKMRGIGMAPGNEPVVSGRIRSLFGPTDFDPTCEATEFESAVVFTSDVFIVRYSCIEPTADVSGDGFVELMEFARMSACLTGPALAPGDGGDGPNEHFEPIVCQPGCAIRDLDSDGDIDLLDLALFANAFTGGR